MASFADIQKHAWNVTPARARAIQDKLRHRVIIEDRLDDVHTVAGIDVGFGKDGNSRDMMRAAVAVLGFPDLKLHEWAIAHGPVTFPYVPGLLSFREVPVVIKALQQLRRSPGLILYDGQGLAHPRRLGIACHLGVMTGLPCIGVAKTRLIGVHDPVPNEKGCWVPLLDNGEVIGAVLRTRTGVKPVYVSIGHRISLQTAIHHVLSCVTRFRLPETTRWAHGIASDKKGCFVSK